MTDATKENPGGRCQRGPGARRLRGTLAAIAVASACSLGARAAEAQTRLPDRVPSTNGSGVDLHLFRPAIDSKGFFSVNGADILGHNDISLGLVLDYGHGIMPLNAGHGADWMVKHAFQGTFQFDYGIKNFLVIGVSVPIVVSSGDEVSDVGPGGARNYSDDGLDVQALGNLALHVKVPILRPDGPIGIALLAQAGVCVGGTRNLAAEPGFFYWPQVVIEERVSILRFALNAGYRGHTGSSSSFTTGKDGKPQLESGKFQNANVFTGSFAMSVRVIPALDLMAETYTTYQIGGDSDAKQKISAEAIGGLKIFVEKNSYLLLGGGAGYAPGFQTAAQRATLGFIFEPSIGARPAAEPDRDHDGIPDKFDKCPDQAEDKNGFEDDDGCPEQSQDGDRDGDGILDKNDKCPDDAEDRDNFEDSDGCPDPDNDKDGIPDKLDKCPNVAEDKDGFEDSDGCPDPDNDKDGILDAVDKCPDQPETFNGSEDEDGCPDTGRVVIEENNIVILDKILFKTGSAVILPESFPIVDAVATTLTHHPEFTMIEVQGHADERGNDAQNLRLTQERANAVVEALVKKGVGREKLRAMGYGEYCPLDPAHSAAAWDKNRRVEFKVAMTQTGPTGVVLGCDAAKAKGVAPPPLPGQQQAPP